MKRTSNGKNTKAKRQRFTPKRDASPGRAKSTLGEMKTYDAELTGTALSAVTTTWVAGTMKDPNTSINLGSAAVANPLSLCVPIVGAALNNRVGRQIKVHSIRVRGTIACGAQAAQSTADSSSVVRILLVQDMQTNIAQMTGAQLMRDAGAADTTIFSMQNPDNFGRFKVLKDKIMNLQDPNMAGEVAAANVIISGKKLNFKLFVKFKQPVLVHFNSTNGGTVADIVDNSFHVVCGTDTTAIGPVISYYSRVSYRDV